jgi:acid phosphatase family membrane protein YuiD
MIILLICLASWAVAQATKFVIGRIKEKHYDWRYFVATGGMPSSHSATVLFGYKPGYRTESLPHILISQLSSLLL